MIKKYLPNFNPESFTLDFEITAIQSTTQIFHSAKINGCNFHFNQSLWGKVQNIGLASSYKDNADYSIFRLHIRMCSALAHISIGDIDEG